MSISNRSIHTRDMPIQIQYTEGEQCFHMKVPFEQKDKVRRVGGVWNQSSKSWKFALDPSIWDEVRVKFKGELLVPRKFLNAMDEVRREQESFARLKAQAEEDTPVEFDVKGVSLNGKNPLFNYQKWGIKCALKVGSGFLIGDLPGLGKSIQAIGIALERKNRGEISNCLIVCLASLKYNWLDEIKKFTRERALVIDGSLEERRQKWMADGYFFKVVNYEMVVKDLFIPQKNRLSIDEMAFRKYLAGSFDMIVVDEIHAIKHHSSQRSQAVKQLNARYKLGLSGTPVDGRLEELHSIFEFLKPGLFESRGRFMERHAIFDQFGAVKAYVGVQDVKDRIGPYYLRRLKEKVLKDLPPKLFKDVYVELNRPEMKLYRELIRGAHEITEEQQAITRVLKARLFLDFPELLELHNPSAKYKALEELLEELVDGNGQKAIVFTQYKQVLDLIVKNLSEKYSNILTIHGGVSSRDRVEIVKEFNEGSGASILVGTDAMSTGLNIGGASAVIHYEDNYSPAIMQQRNDRAHRATTRHNVTIYRFICKDTIEEHVRHALGGKMELNNRLLDENCSEFGVGTLTNLDLLKYL